jgi:betaine-aldehyde dehydrogenase
MTQLYIGGEWRAAGDGGTREIRCPADGTPVATVAEATVDDTEAAIAAARRAFDHGPWPGTSERERGALLFRVAALIERDVETYARAEALDTGKRLVEAEYDMADIV